MAEVRTSRHPIFVRLCYNECMEYVTVDNPFMAALGTLPDDLAEALLSAYREAMGIGGRELPVIEW